MISQKSEQEELAQLRQKLEKHFTLSELRTLLFDLGVDYECIPHRSEKGEATREIVAHFARRNRISELIQACKRLRPHVDWGAWRLPDSVPFLGSVGAGQVDFRPPEEWATAEEWKKVAPDLPYRVDELFALRVQGNSMVKAAVLDDDIIIVRYQPTVENGEIAAVWIKGDEISTLKRLYFNREDNTVELRPYGENENAESIVRLAEEVIVYGKLIQITREPK